MKLLWVDCHVHFWFRTHWIRHACHTTDSTQSFLTLGYGLHVTLWAAHSQSTPCWKYGTCSTLFVNITNVLISLKLLFTYYIIIIWNYFITPKRLIVCYVSGGKELIALCTMSDCPCIVSHSSIPYNTCHKIISIKLIPPGCPSCVIFLMAHIRAFNKQ